MNNLIRIIVFLCYAKLILTGCEIREGFSIYTPNPTPWILIGGGIYGILLARKFSKTKSRIFLVFNFLTIALVVSIGSICLRAWPILTIKPDFKTCRADPLLGYVPIPNTENIEVCGTTYHFDSRGERQVVRHAKKFRMSILFIGCSFTFGAGVNDCETFAAILQTLLPDVEIRNGGVCGYGTIQSLLVLEKALSSTDRPDIILYGFISSHPQRNYLRWTWRRILNLAWAKLPYGQIVNGKLAIMPPVGIEMAIKDSVDLYKPEKEVTLAAIEKMREECSRAGVKFATIFLPEKPTSNRHVHMKIHEWAVEETTRQGVPLINLWSPDPPAEQFQPDGHPSAIGHEYIAKSIFRNPEFKKLLRL